MGNGTGCFALFYRAALNFAVSELYCLYGIAAMSNKCDIRIVLFLKTKYKRCEMNKKVKFQETFIPKFVISNEVPRIALTVSSCYSFFIYFFFWGLPQQS